jgi:hypothetical protein
MFRQDCCAIVRFHARAVAVLLSVSVAACGFVDSSFEPRINTVNRGYDSATNTEVLANIVHASRYEPLRFYLHSKFAPSQTSDIKVGLPTITFGPGQLAAQKQFAFASNLTDNSASLSLEVDPIETHDFHNSLMTPLSLGTIGLVLTSFPRELVFLTLFDSVRFQFQGGMPIEYRNVPTPPSANCPEYHYDGSSGDADYDPSYVAGPGSPYNGVPYDPRSGARYHPARAGSYDNLRNCSYQRFRFWIATAIAYGMSVTFESAPNTKHNPNDPKDTQPATIVVGKFCFDPALAQPSLAGETAVFFKGSACVKTTIDKSTTKSQTNATEQLTFGFPFMGPDQKIGHVDLEIRPRSLLEIFLYLGDLLKMATAQNQMIPVYTKEAQSNGDVSVFQVELNRHRGSCFSALSEGERYYCIPDDGAENTYRLFAMVTELTSLMQTATDVPNSLSVRLTP